METVTSLLYLAFGLVSNMVDRIKGSISKTKEGSEELYHFPKYFCEWCYITWKPIAINSLKLYLNSAYFLKLLLQKIICQERFPYREDTVGQWFKEKIEIPGDPATIDRQINMLNMQHGKKKPTLKKYPLINGKDFLSNLKQEGYRIFFHGTKHESAKNIIEKGISLYELRKDRNQDFSCGRGFYLTGQYEGQTGAVVRAFNCSHDKQAVLIFKVPTQEIERYRVNAKSYVDGDRRELAEAFVQRLRGNEIPQRQKEKIFAPDLSFVEGPYVTMEGNRAVEGSYQICLHSEELAECFDRHLDSAIFFHK